MSDRIEGQVARVLNDRELVINRGAEHGVEAGMRFAVLAKEGIGIEDPETGEPLGDVERPKTLVKVTQVKPRLCVAVTYRTKVVGGGWVSPAELSRRMLGMEPAHEIEETLRAEKTAFARPLRGPDAIVAAGDEAVQVLGEEFSGWDW